MTKEEFVKDIDEIIKLAQLIMGRLDKIMALYESAIKRLDDVDEEKINELDKNQFDVFIAPYEKLAYSGQPLNEWIGKLKESPKLLTTEKIIENMKSLAKAVGITINESGNRSVL